MTVIARACCGRLGASWIGLLSLALVVSACGTVSPVTASGNTATPPETASGKKPPDPDSFALLRRADFADLPGWNTASLGAALRAFRLSCRSLSVQDADRLLPRYAGRVRDWSIPCAAAEDTGDDDASARSFFSGHFLPFAVAPEATASKITGYFEPELQARRTPKEPFTAAIPARPSDLAELKLRDFDANLPDKIYVARLHDGKLTPYPARADIIDQVERALGFARPEDVYFLQIQGSGRAMFSDGEVVRIKYDANNGRPFRSIATHLIEKKKLPRKKASMTGIKDWLRRVPGQEAKKAMNVNPRYIWFRAEPLVDHTRGPVGAQGQPLTPMASLAVDPAYHPYGVPIYLDTRVPRRGGDWRGKPWRSVVIAQDTGNAIRGVVRGDLFFGAGDMAGARAGNMNHEARMWALLPKAVAGRLVVAGLAE